MSQPIRRDIGRHAQHALQLIEEFQRLVSQILVVKNRNRVFTYLSALIFTSAAENIISILLSMLRLALASKELADPSVLYKYISAADLVVCCTHFSYFSSKGWNTPLLA
ncbi:hypothetical protein G6F70_003155 [Rhizopus microsporus]|nr:hypothetical protein G6F71_002344 [Rhizopus microsporus]KAG1201430.1 hypothetical protein G6F70_003155 [Rhizopus microsporus]KAG1212584.1 hypothetical protein G6F69_003571 [Rhizopus microsporus]KAG1234640.1 hypothetical protein G6F67_003377 [Rhizopus microsporus]KAG1266567.1 hypothetical protein G6F68_002650 [Rhizopus microsporus]